MARGVELIVGVVGRAHGIRGDLTIDSRTDEIGRRFAPGAVLYDERDPNRRWTVESHRDHSGRLVVRFDGVEDRSAAEALRGVRLAVRVPADERPDDEDEYYDHQLVGLAVRDHADQPVGVVAEVVHLAAQDMLVIDPVEPGEQILIPFVTALVPVVDLTTRVIRLADVEGLLGEPDEPESDEPESGSGSDGPGPEPQS